MVRLLPGASGTIKGSVRGQEGNGIMRNSRLVVRIQVDTVERYLDEDIGPILIACIRKDRDFQSHLDQLEDIALESRKDGVMVGYILDDLLTYFTNRFGIGGTPTYLMIRNGVVLGTLLGKNSGPELTQFVREAGRRFKPMNSTRGSGRERADAGKISTGRNKGGI